MARIFRSLLLSSRPPPLHRINLELQSRVLWPSWVDLGMDCGRDIDSECGVWDGGIVLQYANCWGSVLCICCACT
jgi:hypothetical protein